MSNNFLSCSPKIKTRTSPAPGLRQDALVDANRNKLYPIHRNCPAEAAMKFGRKSKTSPLLYSSDTKVMLNNLSTMIFI